MSTDALQAGIKAKTLSNFLFAKNPVANAAQLLTDWRHSSRRRRTLRLRPAPANRLGHADGDHDRFALLLELPDPVRLILIGELTVLLPNPNAVLLEMHMDVLGTADFGSDEGSLDAVLHDSNSCGSLCKGRWPSAAVGRERQDIPAFRRRVHPKFQPPPGFPTLQRVSISMPSGNITKFNLDGYFAVSSNTLQIGAHVDIFVGVDGFGICGIPQLRHADRTQSVLFRRRHLRRRRR